MKILYVTTVGAMMNFFKALIKELIDAGNTVDIACNDTISPVDDYYKDLGCKVYRIDCSRSPVKVGNLKAIKQLRAITKGCEYDIVHCHSPIAAVVTRLACRPLRKDITHPVEVFYTAHGFHFYDGAPIKNWLIYYPIEKICAHFTDVLLTMNKEDYERAKAKFKARDIRYVPGVGIDLTKFNQSNSREEKRKELGISNDEIALLSIGELIPRKNHECAIRALAGIDDKHVKYYICGDGILREYLENLADELGVSDRVKLLGRRTDVFEICGCMDLFVFPSFQEGLPVALMEAMACKLPVVASNIRGNMDLLDEDVMFDPHDSNSALEKINLLLNHEISYDVSYAREKLADYSVEKVNAIMVELYEGFRYKY